MSTFYRLPADRKGKWYLIDISGKTLGRVASSIATVLMGKHLPTYTPFWINDDKIVVINAAQVGFSGKKAAGKLYYRHTGYPGGIKVMTLEQRLARDPRQVVRSAVKGMLPKNRLAREMLRNLYIYSGAEHPHQAQCPTVLGGSLGTQRDLFRALTAVAAVEG